jgi:hypothetical protein
VAEGAGGYQAVCFGVHRVADVSSGLAERYLATHGDHGEAAALAGAVVVDHGAAECLDHLLEVEIALGMLFVTESVARAKYVAAVERANAEAFERAHHAILQLLQAVILDQNPEEVLVGEALWVVVQALLRERGTARIVKGGKK